MQPEITIDPAQLDRVQSNLSHIKNGARKAIAGAMNDLMKSARTQIARGAVDEVVMPYGRVLKQVKITRAAPDQLEARLKVDDKNRPGLHHFGARATKNRGVTYRISKSGGRRRIESAFERRGRVFDQESRVFTDQRTPERIFKRAGKKRRPLIDIKGPSLNRVIKKNEVDAIVANTLRTKLPGRVEARMNVLIERGR